jgi:Ca2+-binding EF-hand superfamily protein
MGGRLVLPEADDKMKLLIKTHKLRPKEIAKIFKTFKKFDKAKTGVINLAEFFLSIEEKRNFFTDAIFECFEIDIGK